MDKARERHLREMETIRGAMIKTKSPYVRKDLEKGLRRKEKELRLYDKLKNMKKIQKTS